MTGAHIVLLAVAGLVAGSLNAVAGGGSLISFPALLAAGLGSVPANVTNTVALWPGYAGGALGYRAELSADRVPALKLVAASLVGAGIGSILLLTTPATVFKALVPWLILGATLLFAAQPWVSARLMRRRTVDGALRTSPVVQIGVLAASIYGAYFGAGLGIMLLAILGAVMAIDLQRLNGVKNALALSINTLAMVFFALFGPVRWLPVLIMAVMSLLGGFVGAKVARKLSARVLRAAVVTFGLGVSIALLMN